MNEMLFESEVFGRMKGAFTGANYTEQGRIESANDGTLFLDEIGNIPYPLQVILDPSGKTFRSSLLHHN